MDKHTPLHRLDNVNREKRTAICSTCGTTKIVVYYYSKHPQWTPQICCINRWREIHRDRQRRRREQARLQNPNWKPRHKLSEVDSNNMRAICAICGPTDILRATTYHNLAYYRCATNVRNQAREYSRLHYKPKR
jgi:hypothetical protein